MLCFMRVREDFQQSFIKGTPTFEKSISKVLYRLSGYHKPEIQKI